MAQINPRKQFNFSIQVIPDPINPFSCQRVTLPDIDIDQVEHGEVNGPIKTGGQIKVGNLKIEKLLTTRGSDNYFFNWADSVQSSILGGGVVPDIYKKTIVITEFAEDGRTIINTHTYLGCWPTKINGQSLDRLSSENSIENIELSVDKVAKV